MSPPDSPPAIPSDPKQYKKFVRELLERAEHLATSGGKLLKKHGTKLDEPTRKALEAQLAEQFDHTFLVNADDPLLEQWRALHDQGALDLRVMDNVGMESSARLVWEWANTLLQNRDSGRSCCWKVEARENEKNAAYYEALPAWFRD